jgi:hypothetical protein
MQIIDAKKDVRGTFMGGAGQLVSSVLWCASAAGLVFAFAVVGRCVAQLDRADDVF